MTFEKVKINKAVIYAHLLGFEAFGQTKTARKHFHWFMPDTDDTFTVHYFTGISPSYTVNNQTTSSLEQACKWLQAIERRQNATVA